MRALLLALALSSCTVTYTKPSGWKVVEVNTLDGILEAPGDFCYRTLHGLVVYAQRGVECPNVADVERETAFMLELVTATHDTFDGTRVIFTHGKFIVPGVGWAIGAAPDSTLVVDTFGNWRQTLRHELEHRRRRILYESGNEPSDLNEKAVQLWLRDHDPSWWWGLIERGGR